MTALRYSQAALILAVGYFIYQFTTHDYSAWGIQFRFLTIWGLTAAMVAHYLLFAARRNGRADTYPAFISATAVLNIMVVFDRSALRGLCGVDRGVCRSIQRHPRGQCDIGPDLSVPE